MGNWNIVIHGVGPHHNTKYKDDANRLAADFVAKLKKVGHEVVSAQMHSSEGTDDFTDPAEYHGMRNQYEAIRAATRQPPEPEPEFPTDD